MKKYIERCQKSKIDSQKQSSVIENVNDLLASLGLIPAKAIRQFLLERKKPLFTTPATDARGNKVIFRCAFREDYNKIVKHEKFLYSKATAEKIDFLPHLIKSGEFNDGFWLTYKYIIGKIAGNVYQFRDGINYAPILQFLKDLPVAVETQLKAENFPDISDQRFNWHWILQKSFDEQYSLNDDKEMLEIKYRLSSKISTIKTSSLSHGDLHPQNIFFTKDKITVIDWETAHINSCANDYSFIYIRSHNPKARKEIWQQLVSLHPGIEQEAALVFTIRLMRELVEWMQIQDSQNELLMPKDIINRAKAKDIMVDLKREIHSFSRMI